MFCAGCRRDLPLSKVPSGVRYCERCSRSLREESERFAASLTSVAPGRLSGLSRDPSDKECDFFLSFSEEDIEIAEQMNRILRNHGYRTFLLPNRENSGLKFVHEVQQGLARGVRMIALLSPGFLNSTWREEEWQAVLAKDPDGYPQMLVTFQLTGCEPGATLPANATNLAFVRGTALRDALLKAVKVNAEATSLKQSALAPAAVQASGQRWTRAALAIAAGVLAVVLARTLPSGKTTSPEIGSWASFQGSIQDRSEALHGLDPADHWASGPGPSAFRSSGQSLEVVGSSLLRRTSAVRDGIARYRVSIEKGGVSLFARCNPDFDSCVETRLDPSGGEIRIRSVLREACALTGLGTDVIPAGGRTMHDIGLSVQSDYYTVWLGDGPVSTFRSASLQKGAFGIGASASDQVRLFGWSINAEPEPETLAMLLRH